MTSDQPSDQRSEQPSVCVVTGAASGIGLATAEALLAAGWNVVGVDVDDGEHVRVRGDVADRETHRRARAAALDLGVLRGWINDAGIGNPAADHAGDLDDDAARAVVGVNFLGTAWGCAEAVTGMLDHGEGGAIVNLSSVQAIRNLPSGFVYSGTKAGIDGLTRQLAVDYATQRIRANSVQPGAILTAMNEAKLARQPDPVAARRREEWVAPAGRLGTPDEVAELITWLITTAPDFLTGQAIGIDGGAAGWLNQTPPS